MQQTITTDNQTANETGDIDMSLNWNCSKVANFDELKTDAESRITNRIVWLTMAIDIGEITKKNAVEFYTRCKIVERIHGQDDDSPITFDMIERRIGMYTNVTDRTANQFDKRIATHLRRKVETMRQAEIRIARCCDLPFHAGACGCS